MSAVGGGHDELVDDIRVMVECESPSSDHDAVARSAEVVAGVGAARLGVAAERIVLDGVTHLRWRLGAAPGRLLVLGHHDTVWPLGTLDRLPFGVEGGVMRGPGCVDMKAGVAMAFHALVGLEGVTLLVTGDEELGAPTSRALIEEEARIADACLVLEAAGPGGALKTARKGISRYDVHVGGRAAHAGLEPERGVNATLELAHQALAVAALADPAAGTSVTPTQASSGSAANTVPASGSFAVDVRAWDATEQQRVDEAMQALQARVPGATVTVSGGPNRGPLEKSMSRSLLALATSLAARLGVPTPTTCAVGGASDGNIAAAVGTPTLDGLGASGGGAHADDEHVLVEELLTRTRLVAALATELVRS